MKDLVLFLATALVDDPASVQITEKTGETSVTYYLHVRKEDLGNVIGKKGRTAKALRAFLYATGKASGIKVHLEVVEPALPQASVAA